VCFFSAKAFLILAIVTAKIIYLGFLASYANRVTLIMRISRVLSLFGSSIVSYLGLGLVLSTELVLDLGLGSLSILFYYRILVLLVVLCDKLKFLLSLGRCSA